MKRELDLTADYIDVRDIIARVEELREEREQSDIAPEAYGGPDDDWQEERAELANLESVLSDLRGNGGDEQFEGDRYPVTLIRDSYFVDVMQELVSDIGDLPRNITAYLAIDWDATADNLRADYSSTEIDGVTYWYR